MRLKLGIFLTYSICLLLFAPLCYGEVELELKSEMKFTDPPVDMTLSRDGQWLYLLHKNGDLVVYDYNRKEHGKVAVGTGFDQIEAGPRMNEVYLLSRKNNKIQIIEAIPARGIDTSGSPFKGVADAPVVIVEFTDFQCPYCAKMGSIFSDLLKKYPGKIKIVYKSFPLNNHKYAWKAAANAMAAHQKGKFWEFHDQLFANSKSLDDNKIKEIRKTTGLDSPEFETLVKSDAVRRKVAEDLQEGQRLGVRGTPTVFVNGKLLKNKTLDGFSAAIDKELKK